MADVYDRWHRSRPDPDAPLCREHRKQPTAEHGTGHRWQVRYRDPSGRQKKENFARKPDADRRLQAVGGDLVKGVYHDPKAGRITLERYVETVWWPNQVSHRNGTRKKYRSNLENHILPELGESPIASIKRSHAKAFVTVMKGKLKPSTVWNVVAAVRSILQDAVNDGDIPSNPFSKIPLPEVEPRVLVPLTAAQVQAFADAMAPRYRVAIWLGAGAGLRISEVLGLTVDRVLFLQRKIMVEEQGQGDDLVPLKTKASKAAVPVDDLILEKLAQHLAEYPPPAVKLSSGRTVKLVLPSVRKRMIHLGTFDRIWRAAAKDAELPEGTRFHDLRHFYASTLIAAGLHPKVIQSRLRHATLSETMDTYGHLFPDHEEHGRGALDAAFRASSEGTPRAHQA